MGFSRPGFGNGEQLAKRQVGRSHALSDTARCPHWLHAHQTHGLTRGQLSGCARDKVCPTHHAAAIVGQVGGGSNEKPLWATNAHSHRFHQDKTRKPLFNAITWSDVHVAQLFTGHRGSGKSTELLRLQARLVDAGYVVLYFEADDDLDLNDLEYTDLLLSIARRVTSDLESKRVDLPEDLLRNVAHWFSETLYTEEQLMLYNLSVLEYVNAAPPWHDVHPAVTRLPKRLREALPLVRRLRDNSLKSRSQDILRSLDAGPEAKDM